MASHVTTEAPATTAGALGPCPYGLTRAELRAELRRLTNAGFQLWELRKLFGRPRDWHTGAAPTTTTEEANAW